MHSKMNLLQALSKCSVNHYKLKISYFQHLPLKERNKTPQWLGWLLVNSQQSLRTLGRLLNIWYLRASLIFSRQTTVSKEETWSTRFDLPLQASRKGILNLFCGSTIITCLEKAFFLGFLFFLHLFFPACDQMEKNLHIFISVDGRALLSLTVCKSPLLTTNSDESDGI